MTQPGWHPDPEGVPNQLRWWDGRQWTSATHPIEATPLVSADRSPEADPMPPASVATSSRRRTGLVAAGVVGAIVVAGVTAAAVGGRDAGDVVDAASSTTPPTATTSTQVSATTLPQRPSTSHAHAPAVTTTTRPAPPLPAPAKSATGAGCEEADPDILSTIEGSLTEGRTIREVAAVSTLHDGIEYIYTAGNVYKADGTRSVSGVVWVTPGLGVMGLSGNSRTVSTLPFGRGILDVSAGDEFGTKVQDCVSAIARGR